MHILKRFLSMQKSDSTLITNCQLIKIIIWLINVLKITHHSLSWVPNSNWLTLIIILKQKIIKFVISFHDKMLKFMIIILKSFAKVIKSLICMQILTTFIIESNLIRIVKFQCAIKWNKFLYFNEILYLLPIFIRCCSKVTFNK